MRTFIVNVSLIGTVLLGAAAPLVAQHQREHHQEHQPYAGQQTRQIKALSESEIQGYLNGEGMGFAKAAELNRFPGPRHVLDLADRLALTPEQEAKTQTLFEEMRTRAVELGERVVAREIELDRLFAETEVDDASLRHVLHEIALTKADLRGTHLRAHLAVRELLTEWQISEYDRLRGYDGRHDHGAHH